MAWYTIPGFIVSVLTIIQLLFYKRVSDIEDLKRNILLNLIKSAQYSVLIVIVELIVLYFFYKDLGLRYFYNDIVLEYSLYLYLFIFIDVFLLLWLLPYFSNDTIKVEKYGDQYLIQSKSTSKNINVGIMYFVEKFWDTIGLKISTFLYRLLLFSSLLMWIIVGWDSVHYVRPKDSKYPFVANEKIFVKNTKPIDIYEVKDNKITKGTLPKDKVFSIAKGTEFSFDYEKLKNKLKNKRGGEFNIYNGVYGLLSSKKISIRKGSKLYFEEMGDFAIYVNDKSNELSEYYTVKTVPGKTYIQSDSSMNYEVIANPERNVKDTVYGFIVGYTKENIDYTQFLHNAVVLDGILMIISIIAALCTLWKYLYIFALIFFSIFPLSIIKANGISWGWVILLGIILIEILNYMFFLSQNIFIKRLNSMSEVSIEVLTPKSGIIFTESDKNKIDLRLKDDNWDDKTKYKYTVFKNNGKKLEGELRIIAYKSVWNILGKYFSNYNWIFKIIKALPNLFNKDKSND